MITRIFLTAFALLFFAFGLWSMTDPAGMTTSLGVEAGGVSGIFEVRGIYGGVSLGLAGLALAGALKADMQRPALWALTAYFGGYVVGRAASFFAGDTAGAANWGYAGFELFGCLACTALLIWRAK